MTGSCYVASATPATTTGGGGNGAWSDSEQWGNSFRQEDDWQTITGSDALTVISNEGCCMSRVVTQLLYSLGANPRVVELAANDEGFLDTPQELPFILVGGHALGGVDKLFAAHIAGNLIPQLKAAGALWL
ncbi:hypothetical protein KP509_35G039100 [Ceratopteris richardii]|uniref:Glutaredoxin n=2 Tax=Ceratopteris richardii TaxID=49495 RepID=A0A8T2QFD7_CERRI|nr:hypothetical protein KP509_35G039000 [Ceratopteris richardii]KAH7282600.1 hypothetical protein KP509_35G039100 [Ceratopteris richardii]